MDETERRNPGTGTGALKTLIFYFFAVKIILQMQTTNVEESGFYRSVIFTIH